jgi:hypothetical protein
VDRGARGSGVFAEQQKGTAKAMRTIEDPGDDRLLVTPPKTWATGVPAVTRAVEYSLGQTTCAGPR